MKGTAAVQVIEQADWKAPERHSTEWRAIKNEEDYNAGVEITYAFAVNPEARAS